MLTLTDKAREKVGEIVAQQDGEAIGLRLRAAKVGSYTFRYQLHLVRDEDRQDDDVVLEQPGFQILIDPESHEWMQDCTIEFVENDQTSGFQIDNPLATPEWPDELSKKVQEVIDHRLLPALAQHGGWMELDRIEGDTAYVRLGGGCQGCASASVTLKDGVERVIVEHVEEISHVIDVTDHAAGTSPHCSC
jgi:Fe/S biogenesis protein NfuA